MMQTTFEKGKVDEYVNTHYCDPIQTSYNMGYKNALKDVLSMAKNHKDVATLCAQVKQTRNNIKL